MIRRIDHVSLTVSNLEASTAFYHEHFGFVLDRTMWLPEAALHINFLSLGDTILELFGVPEIRGTMVTDINEIVGYKHIALLVDNVDAEYDRLLRSGLKFHSPPTTVQGERVAFLKDLDGADIELIQHLQKEHA
jgi:catechol 2,3-dioxygenase-like lactoylglutathione lyase family enzyme